ncbi:hypothetical protein NHX12_023660 [Muraenolepis orangiensis]|uniref:Synaptotagmin-like protein 1 n=1 Tax=Muraenolepis orangiensis TaxID=630683 RepID=A0A9Q0ENI5_9TELE|nr:hypothetical protein NHX12_023660 [Muraenolepis orangiensis]
MRNRPKVDEVDLSVCDGGMVDGGMVDGGMVDGGMVDGGMVDGGMVDGGMVDGGMVDGGMVDGGAVDGGMVDGGTIDGGTVDGGMVDGGTVDGGMVDGCAFSRSPEKKSRMMCRLIVWQRVRSLLRWRKRFRTEMTSPRLQKEELLVSVCRCEDLATARKNHSDPYVKTYLLPDKSSHSKMKTKVKKNTQNPVYDQTLKYKVPVGELRGRTLNLSVWHAAALGRNIFLGEVELTLASWDWVQMGPGDISSRGILVFSLKFIPEGSEGELHIWLREAQGLMSFKGGAVDSFVKSYILPDASRQSGQKTRAVKHSISPAYNHTMVYDGFHSGDLLEACAELTVWQRERRRTRLLGGVRLSPGSGRSYGEDVSWMDSTREEVAVWSAMMENPHSWIDASLPIRTNIKLRKN